MLRNVLENNRVEVVIFVIGYVKDAMLGYNHKILPFLYENIREKHSHVSVSK
jgi:hypothetical protein